MYWKLDGGLSNRKYINKIHNLMNVHKCQKVGCGYDPILGSGQDLVEVINYSMGDLIRRLSLNGFIQLNLLKSVCWWHYTFKLYYPLGWAVQFLLLYGNETNSPFLIFCITKKKHDGAGGVLVSSSGMAVRPRRFSYKLNGNLTVLDSN